MIEYTTDTIQPIPLVRESVDKVLQNFKEAFKSLDLNNLSTVEDVLIAACSMKSLLKAIRNKLPSLEEEEEAALPYKEYHRLLMQVIDGIKEEVMKEETKE